MAGESPKSGLSATTVDRASPREKLTNFPTATGSTCSLSLSACRGGMRGKDAAGRAIAQVDQKMRMAGQLGPARYRQSADHSAAQDEDARSTMGRTFSTYLFPSIRSTKRPLSDNTINAALRRMGYEKDSMTAHGFRAMAATCSTRWAPESRCDRTAIGSRRAELVRRAYTRGQHWDERMRMMQH